MIQFIRVTPQICTPLTLHLYCLHSLFLSSTPILHVSILYNAVSPSILSCNLLSAFIPSNLHENILFIPYQHLSYCMHSTLHLYISIPQTTTTTRDLKYSKHFTLLVSQHSQLHSPPINYHPRTFYYVNLTHNIALSVFILYTPFQTLVRGVITFLNQSLVKHYLRIAADTHSAKDVLYVWCSCLLPVCGKDTKEYKGAQRKRK